MSNQERTAETPEIQLEIIAADFNKKRARHRENRELAVRKQAAVHVRLASARAAQLKAAQALTYWELKEGPKVLAANKVKLALRAEGLTKVRARHEHATQQAQKARAGFETKRAEQATSALTVLAGARTKHEQLVLACAAAPTNAAHAKLVISRTKAQTALDVAERLVIRAAAILVTVSAKQATIESHHAKTLTAYAKAGVLIHAAPTDEQRIAAYEKYKTNPQHLTSIELAWRDFRQRTNRSAIPDNVLPQKGRPG